MSKHRIEIEFVRIAGEPDTMSITVDGESPSAAQKSATRLRELVEASDARSPQKSIEHIRDYPVKSEN